jgi:hypothetical protein
MADKTRQSMIRTFPQERDERLALHFATLQQTLEYGKSSVITGPKELFNEHYNQHGFYIYRMDSKGNARINLNSAHPRATEIASAIDEITQKLGGTVRQKHGNAVISKLDASAFVVEASKHPELQLDVFAPIYWNMKLGTPLAWFAPEHFITPTTSAHEREMLTRLGTIADHLAAQHWHSVSGGYGKAESSAQVFRPMLVLDRSEKLDAPQLQPPFIIVPMEWANRQSDAALVDALRPLCTDYKAFSHLTTPIGRSDTERLDKGLKVSAAAAIPGVGIPVVSTVGGVVASVAGTLLAPIAALSAMAAEGATVASVASTTLPYVGAAILGMPVGVVGGIAAGAGVAAATVIGLNAADGLVQADKYIRKANALHRRTKGMELKQGIEHFDERFVVENFPLGVASTLPPDLVELLDKNHRVLSEQLIVAGAQEFIRQKDPSQILEDTSLNEQIRPPAAIML